LGRGGEKAGILFVRGSLGMGKKVHRQNTAIELCFPGRGVGRGEKRDTRSTGKGLGGGAPAGLYHHQTTLLDRGRALIIGGGAVGTSLSLSKKL